MTRLRGSEATRQRDLVGLVKVVRDKVLDEIGECAAYVPKRKRAPFAELLRAVASALVEDDPPPAPAETRAIDGRVRQALALTAGNLATAFPDLRGWIADTLKAAAKFVDKIPMGTKRMPRPRPEARP